MALYKVLMMDWDGTLIDSLPIKMRNAGLAFSQLIEVGAEAVEQSFASRSGVPRHILFNQIAQDTAGRDLSDGEFKQLSRNFTELNVKDILESSELRSGVHEALGKLKSLGVKLFISTSVPLEEMVNYVDRYELSQYLVETLGSKPGFGKGAEHIAYAMEKTGAALIEVISIGDEERDIELAIAAGIDCIGIAGTKTKEVLETSGATYVIDEFNQVLNHVP